MFKRIVSETTQINLRLLPTQFCVPDLLKEFLQKSLDRDIEIAKFTPSFRWFYAIRRWIPVRLRQQIQRLRNQRLTVQDRWFIPQELEQAISQLGIEIPSPWPERAEIAFVLTHDVETQQGFDRILEIASMEEELGLRSSWSLVPFKYRIDAGVVRELRARGHEIAVHGYNHDGTLFLKKSIFDYRLKFINQAMRDLDAKGFRAPMVHRNLYWMQELDAEYDSSCFDIDPFQAMPGGVMGIWPFQVGRLIELPYTLPQDHTLFVTLGETTTRVWEEKMAFLRRHHGMALMLTHPDYLILGQSKELYRQFLESTVQQGGFWHVLPQTLANWFATNFGAKAQ
jgi:peptidoglycan/xylan/chitin deacetylase (PgdA/CDA1 family)